MLLLALGDCLLFFIYPVVKPRWPALEGIDSLAGQFSAGAEMGEVFFQGNARQAGELFRVLEAEVVTYIGAGKSVALAGGHEKSRRPKPPGPQSNVAGCAPLPHEQRHHQAHQHQDDRAAQAGGNLGKGHQHHAPGR